MEKKTRLDLQEQKLIMDNIDILDRVTGIYSGYLPEAELKSCAAEAVCMAALTFDPDKGASFATYAGKCIRNSIISEMRRQGPPWEQLGPATIKADVGRERGEGDAAILRRALYRLSPRDQFAMIHRFGLAYYDQPSKSQTEVAGLLGWSQSYYSRHERAILKKLKQMIREED